MPRYEDPFMQMQRSNRTRIPSPAARTCAILLPLVLSGGLLAEVATRPALRQVSLERPQPHLELGSPAPEIVATTLDGKPTSLAALRTAGKPLVLQFGSLTDPVFRLRAPAVEKLAAKYADKAVFVLVYAEESHPADTSQALDVNKEGFNIAQPTSLAERQKLASQTVERLKIRYQSVIVDAWNNTSSLRYGSYPNMTFIIDGKGLLQAGYPWMDPTKVGAALDALLADKPLSPQLKGSVKPSGAAPLDTGEMAMEMTGGGRGPGAVGAALDRLKLTPEQRKNLYPAIAEYFASLQAFRETMNNAPAPLRAAAGRGRGRGRGNRGAPPPPPPSASAAAPMMAETATGTEAEKKVSTPKEVQAANDSLHNAAEKLKTQIKQNLPDKDAAEIIATLNRSNGQRLFAD
jgi:thiol-disulfide isomerase/thioredoxin